MQLHSYQTRAINFWLEHPRAYLAIDMGLGKTAIVLHTLAALKKPALVLAPLAPVYNTWPDEIRKWKLPLSYSIVHGPNKARALKRKVDIYITNYETLPWLHGQMVTLAMKDKPYPFEILVIDEGTKLKSSTTKRFDFAQSLMPMFPKYRVILSGTPAPNALYDLWAQYFLLDDGKCLGQNFHAFRRRYYSQEPWDQFNWYIKPGADGIIHKSVAPITFRLDEKDHLKLPAITHNYIKLDLPEKLRKDYKEFSKEFLLTVNDIDIAALSAAALQQKLRQFLQGFLYYYDDNKLKVVRKTVDLHNLKLTRLKQLVDETNQPILCAIQFKHELQLIRKHFPKAPAIVGGVSTKDRSRYLRDWNKGKIPLLLCHPASLSHGVNIQAGGNIIVWYCLPWSLELHQQFNKRLHRQGQKRGVIIHYLLVKDTIDDKVAHVLNQKGMTQQRLLDYLRDVTNY